MLSTDILAKIFQYLLDDASSYRNLSRTCKRFCQVATHPIQRTPNIFNFYLDLEHFSRVTCESHEGCADLFLRTQCRCEQQLAYKQSLKNRPCDSELLQLNSSVCCYYHRLYCMLQARYVTFSGLKFYNHRLIDTGCMTVFENFRDTFKLSALVDSNSITARSHLTGWIL